jgi:hypothetical protein
MSTQIVIELPNREGAQVVVHALESYKARLEASIERTKRRLQEFEQKYSVTTAFFLSRMAAEDLTGGDLEYIEWSGEAQLLEKLEAELKELEHAHYQLP